MPQPGTPNNPSGENGWQGFGTEQPYGEATKQKQLQQAAPLAGAPIAAGPINAPRRAKQQAGQQPAPPQLPVAPPQGVPTANVWQQLAATPGASPLVLEYAAKALQQ